MEVWEEHAEVYHYTTVQGLGGILESQSLHATHFMYMNDPTEMHQIRPKMEQLVLPHVVKRIEELAANPKIKAQVEVNGGIDKVTKHDAENLVDALYRVTLGLGGGTRFFQPYVVSFCGHKRDYERANGLLSQWRAYGKDSGYAIVFDTKKLAELVKEEMKTYLYDFWSMGDVVYDNEEAKFDETFKELIKAIDKDAPRLIRSETGVYDALNLQFMASIPRFKHRGFFEESEVRIVVSPTDSDGVKMMKKSGNFEKHKDKKLKDLQYRDTLAPYVVLFDDPKLELPITRIIVGPHSDKVNRQRKLEKHLELRGLSIKATCSETPLV